MDYAKFRKLMIAEVGKNGRLAGNKHARKEKREQKHKASRLKERNTLRDYRAELLRLQYETDPEVAARLKRELIDAQPKADDDRRAELLARMPESERDG